MTFTKRWCKLKPPTHSNSTKQHIESMNYVFANRSEDEEVYPLTVKEIAAEQQKDQTVCSLKNDTKYETLLIENTQVLCREGKLVIPKSLQHREVLWYHHYLQHPGHSHLEETLRAAMYWKSMRHTIRSYVKKCRSCQINKRRKLKYGKLPSKLVVTTPWEALCVDLIGPYTLKSKDWFSRYPLPMLSKHYLC